MCSKLPASTTRGIDITTREYVLETQRPERNRYTLYSGERQTCLMKFRLRHCQLQVLLQRTCPLPSPSPPLPSLPLPPTKRLSQDAATYKPPGTRRASGYQPSDWLPVLAADKDSALLKGPGRRRIEAAWGRDKSRNQELFCFFYFRLIIYPFFLSVFYFIYLSIFYLFVDLFIYLFLPRFRSFFLSTGRLINIKTAVGWKLITSFKINYLRFVIHPQMVEWNPRRFTTEKPHFGAIFYSLFSRHN